VATDGSKKLHKLTFSKSLADWLVDQAKEKWGLELKVERIKFIIGKKLYPHDDSSGKAYAIMSNSKGIALRATLCRKTAELMRCESRDIHELWLLPV
jgi:hypothetical protein